MIAMQKKLLYLLLASGPVFAVDEPRFCQVEGRCTPCGQNGGCSHVNGQRIDHGASLGALLTPDNAERQLTTETFVLSDADPVPSLVKAPIRISTPTPIPVAASAPILQSLGSSADAQTPLAEGSQAAAPTTRTIVEPGERSELAPSSFISGGSEMGDTLKSRLERLVEYLKPHQKLHLEVIGHTDNQHLSAISRARYRDNQGLGQSRADIVAAYLGARLGLAPGRITTASRGQDRPLTSNDTLAGMAQNRRVEIHAWYEDERQEVVPPAPSILVPAPIPAPVPVVAAPAPVLAAPAPAPAVPLLPVPQRSCAEVLASRTRAEDLPFRISIDGVAEEDGVIDPDIQRCTDVALEKADIQIRYDSLEQTPVLNAHAWPNAVVQGGVVEFTGWSNYQAFIARAEVRIFAPDATTQGAPLAVLPLQLGQPLAWQVPNLKDDHVVYVLRVYDGHGHFDETRAKMIELTDRARPAKDVDKRERELLAGYGENSLSIHNIQVHGGAVTANGSGIKVGELVSFLGQSLPVDAKGVFAARQILPAGPHVVEVEVKKPDGSSARYDRNLSIADDDWFYMGLADLTAGRNATNNSAAARLVSVDPTDHYDNKTYVDGRLAFYLKGKVKGEWLQNDWQLTASADTREQPLRSLFTNFAEKDPRYLLRSLDANKYYPVYGDDSTAIDDAPTRGKFFVRLARGDSRILWGSFKTSLTGTQFANFSRALYGADVKLVSDAATKYGEKRSTLEVFAADPGTLQSREEYRGTGGSLYYLHNIDITPGSEHVWLEVRDKDSGLVLKTQQLVAVQDYDVNNLQGRITLREALASTASTGTLVQSGNLGGDPQYLVATYEYAPGVISVSSMVVGGRASAWLNDSLQVGTTAYRQDGPVQRLKDIDATWRYKPGTYVKLEGARTDGAGTVTQTSQDGGFGFNAMNSGGGKAGAQRVEAAVDFADVSHAKGKATYYWQNTEAGFSGPGQITFNSEATLQQGGSLAWQASDKTDVKLKADVKLATSLSTKAVEVDVGHVLNANWKASLGLRDDDRGASVANVSPTLSQSGNRVDAVVRMDYTPDAAAGWTAYGYGQGTLEKSGSRAENDRVGLGGERRINDRFKLIGEVSDGNGGLGSKIGGTWQVDDRTSYYTNYSLSPDRTDDGFSSRAGLLTVGGKTRYTDTLSVNAEERYQYGYGPSGLIHAFGLDIAPNDRWNYGVKMETGKLSDPLAGDTKRQALGLSVGYHEGPTRYASALEYRSDDNSLSGSQITWLMKNTLGYQVDPDWRFLGRLNFSTSSSHALQNGEYLELVTGYAWRPVKNDRWNTLFKYTYLHNVPTAGQVDATGTSLGYAQKSHVLDLDTIYDLRPWVSVGAKLGVRRSELQDTTLGGDWYSSTAWLGILRADWHWVHEWDILTEVRTLDASTASNSQTGALVGVYRHLNKHVKLGGGYNFTHYSDDLTDLSYRSHGWFINLIGTM